MILLTYNIQYGFGLDGAYELDRVASVLAGSDIIALQEVERFWTRSNLDDQPLLLEQLLPDYHTVFGPGLDMDASLREGDRVINRRRQFGPMILSRWPILWSRLHLLPMRRMIQPLNTQSAALEACIATPHGPVRLINLHLAHVGTEERLEQIAHLKWVLARQALAGPPWSGQDDEPGRNWTEGQAEPPNPDSLIVMGDFNAEPGGEEMRALLGQNPSHPGALYQGGLVDAVARARVRLHTHVKLIAGQTRQRQLDHVLVSADLAAGVRAAWTDFDIIASDHLPLWVELRLAGEAPRIETEVAARRAAPRRPSALRPKGAQRTEA